MNRFFTSARPLCLALLFVLIASVQWSFGEPLFKNSVTSNDLDFIHSDDPAVAFEVHDAGRGRREMPDKRSDELFVDDVFLFEMKYEDKANFEVWADSDFGDRKSAAELATLVGAALGKLPAALRKRLHHVVIHSGDETAFAEEEAHFFVLYSDNMRKRVSTHDLEETVFHETIHATLEAEHALHPDWVRAQKSDPGFITEYAAKHPAKEDLPESALFAYAICKQPGRLPLNVEAAVRELMPNRLRYLEKLFESLELESSGAGIGHPVSSPRQ